ncbi:MAG: hypothetical protein KatS3mg115_0058 [Candidatus Poribacteria bacterium]|nr:MAG: hypothetical protein KatS3mg115_0058 [Candidatus Poribacteria bacterium]
MRPKEALLLIIVFAGGLVGCNRSDLVEDSAPVLGEGVRPPAIVGAVEPAAPGIGVLALRNGVQTRSTLTDSEGRYLLEALLPGEYNLIVSGAGFFTDTSLQGLVVSEGEIVQAPTVRLRPLAAAATLSGRVVDGITGLPLPDVSIVVRCRTGICANLEVRTDAMGRFETDVWPELPGELLVQKRRYRPLAVPFDPLPPHSRLELPTIRLTPE